MMIQFRALLPNQVKQNPNTYPTKKTKPKKSVKLVTEKMGEALEALRIAEGADIDIHGSRTLQNTKNRSTKLVQLQNKMPQKL